MIRSLVLAVALLLGVVAPAGLAGAVTPTDPEARVQKERGDLLKSSGDLPAAEQAYRLAIKADAGYAQAHEALGSALYAQKRFDEAVRAFGDAVAVDPSLASAWYSLAFAQRRVGNLGQARTAYQGYVALRPADPDGHYGLAETLRGLKDRDPAVAEYRRFVELAQANPAQAPWVEKARAAIAELQGEGGKVAPGPAVSAPAAAAAVAAPTAVTAIGPTASSGAMIAPAPAQPPAVQAQPEPPSRVLIEKLGAGDRAYLAGDFRAALFAYQDAVYLAPSSTTARIRLARAYVALHYPAQAETQLKQVLDLDPGNEEARRGLEELKNPPPPPTPVTAPGSSKSAAGGAPRLYKLTDDAAGLAAAAVIAGRSPPAPPPATFRTAAPAPAEPPIAVVAAPVAVASPAAADAAAAARHYRTGLDLMATRDYKGAIIELDQAIAANPGLGAAFSARASAFYGLGRYDEATRDYETAIGLAPNLATPLYGLAESYRKLGDPRAAEWYQRYADSDAGDVREELRLVARKRVGELGGPPPSR